MGAGVTTHRHSELKFEILNFHVTYKNINAIMCRSVLPSVVFWYLVGNSVVRTHRKADADRKLGRVGVTGRQSQGRKVRVVRRGASADRRCEHYRSWRMRLITFECHGRVSFSKTVQQNNCHVLW